MNYTQILFCPHCNEEIKICTTILEDGTPFSFLLEKDRTFPTLQQLKNAGIELGIVIENE